MLSIVSSAALSLLCRFKSGGIIVNEHTLTLDQTRSHVDILHRHFDFISLAELPNRMGLRHKRPFCLLTFDDGKRSNATVTAPELCRLGVPAVFFVVSGFLDGKRPLWFDRYRLLQEKLGKTLPYGLSSRIVKQLPYDLLLDRIDRACERHGVQVDATDEDICAMTWDHARELHKRGFIIGAHGVTHAVMTRETAANAFDNISRSIAEVSAEIGEPCNSFAFPNGNYTAQLASHAVRCGVRFVMSTEPTWVDQRFPLWRLPRLQLFGPQSRQRIERKISAAALGCILANPDGTGRTYRLVNRLDKLTKQRATQSSSPQPNVATALSRRDD